MTMNFDGLVNLILEQKNTHAKWGIIFRKKGNKDIGCCIGVRHGKSITLSKNLIERIQNIPNLKFYAEGVAAKDPSKEPGMLPFLKKTFPNTKIEKLSWDEITEQKNKGSANSKYNVVYVFMQHRYNKVIELYPYTKGTMLDAFAKPKIKDFPKNTPSNFEDRKNWLTKHMKAAGFYEKLNQPYNKNKLLKIMDEMEYSVYPNQQHPDTSTYFGKMQHHIEEERNKTIYDLMSQGGCCFAGSGHLIELKQQFSDLEDIDLDNI